MNFPLVSPYGDLTEVKLDYCITTEVKKKKNFLKNSYSTSIFCRIIYIFLLFIEIQPLYFLRGKMCKKLEK